MRNVIKYKGQTLVDICMEEFGGVEGIVALARDNALAVDTELALTSLIVIDESIENIVRKTLPVLPVLIDPALVTTEVTSGQNVVDLVLKEYGSLEGIISLLRLNGLGVTSTPVTGSQIKVEVKAISDAVVREFFKNSGIRVNTGWAPPTAPPIGDRLLLEDGFYRLLEDGSFRLLE